MKVFKTSINAATRDQKSKKVLVVVSSPPQHEKDRGWKNQVEPKKYNWNKIYVSWTSDDRGKV